MSVSNVVDRTEQAAYYEDIIPQFATHCALRRMPHRCRRCTVLRKAIGAIAAFACSQAVELPEFHGGVKPCCTKAHLVEHSLL